MNVCFALFYENRSGIKKSVINFVFFFLPNTGTKFREPYRFNHVIPHRVGLSYENPLPSTTIQIIYKNQIHRIKQTKILGIVLEVETVI